MNRRIQEIFTIAEGRYLTKEESDHISQHAASVAARLQAMQEVSEKESAIVEGTMREVLRAYPDLEQKYRAARPKGTRDIALALRFATSAMVRNDPDALQAELLSWFNTILKGLGLAASFVEDTYKTLERIAARELSPDTMEKMSPFLSQLTIALSSRRSEGKE
ncbi:MAG TPA: hypothetical protein PKO07_16630 [Pseudomonadota bacterium]|nr:hypothetical protein [Pseudomonadota bacterium]HNN52656.1 hypothetical protein [Pseudomonadota bacterium]